VTKQLLNAKWLSCLSHFNKLIVGFSGGLDSTVLLHALASCPSLCSKLVAVHVNHGISAHAPKWQAHCQQFCQNSGIDFITQAVQFNRLANIEEGARIARYAVFSSLMTDKDCLLLAHHQDDQAETVLLQLFRGAGIDGLAAMAESGRCGLGTLARPLLHYSREHLEHYAALHQLAWIEDDSNYDINYSRNYLRHQIMPLLIAKWSGVAGNIARTATHCQQARINLDDLAIEDCPELLAAKDTLFIGALEGLSFERMANVLRVWLKKNQIPLPSTLTFNRLILEVIQARPDAVPEVGWAEFLVRRYQQCLYLDKKHPVNLPVFIEWSEFPLPLRLGGTDIHLLAKKADHGLSVMQNTKVSIRFRQGGEEMLWHGQNKQLKKLFQEWNVPPWSRDRLPLIYINDTLAAVVGYAVSDLFYTKDSSQAWLITTQQICGEK